MKFGFLWTRSTVQKGELDTLPGQASLNLYCLPFEDSMARKGSFQALQSIGLLDLWSLFFLYCWKYPFLKQKSGTFPEPTTLLKVICLWIINPTHTADVCLVISLCQPPASACTYFLITVTRFSHLLSVLNATDSSSPLVSLSWTLGMGCPVTPTCYLLSVLV